MSLTGIFQYTVQRRLDKSGGTTPQIHLVNTTYLSFSDVVFKVRASLIREVVTPQIQTVSDLTPSDSESTTPQIQIVNTADPTSSDLKFRGLFIDDTRADEIVDVTTGDWGSLDLV